VKGDHAMLTMEGGCHCGRVRFRVTADLAVIDCNCSICIKKGILHLIVPPERFELISGKDDLTTYEFNTKTAKHTFCKHCGIHPFYVPRSDPGKIDVNARCLDDIDVAELAPTPFDGKNLGGGGRAARVRAMNALDGENRPAAITCRRASSARDRSCGAANNVKRRVRFE